MMKCLFLLLDVSSSTPWVKKFFQNLFYIKSQCTKTTEKLTTFTKIKVSKNIAFVYLIALGSQEWFTTAKLGLSANPNEFSLTPVVMFQSLISYISWALCWATCIRWYIMVPKYTSLSLKFSIKWVMPFLMMQTLN